MGMLFLAAACRVLRVRVGQIKLTGGSYEIVREIQRRLPSNDPIEVVPWIRGRKEHQGQANIVLFSMDRPEDRDPLFEWVDPIREVTCIF